MGRKEFLDNFYNNICDEEARLNNGNYSKVEFVTTLNYINKYLKPNSKILEVGAGTGKYSIHFAELGHDVNAIEYVQHNVDVLKSKIQKDISIKAEQGDALDLSRFADNTFDVTLVLGPLYHLYTLEDQKQAISEAIRVTKKDGIVAIAYITSDAIMIGWAIDGHLIDGQNKDFDENFKMINYEEGIFAAFHIKEFKDLMSQFNVTFLNSVATDGMSEHLKDKINALSEEEFNVWLKYHLSTCEREDLQGYSNHMLYICRKN